MSIEQGKQQESQAENREKKEGREADVEAFQDSRSEARSLIQNNETLQQEVNYLAETSWADVGKLSPEQQESDREWREKKQEVMDMLEVVKMPVGEAARDALYMKYDSMDEEDMERLKKSLQEDYDRILNEEDLSDSEVKRMYMQEVSRENDQRWEGMKGRMTHNQILEMEQMTPEQLRQLIGVGPKTPERAAKEENAAINRAMEEYKKVLAVANPGVDAEGIAKMAQLRAENMTSAEINEQIGFEQEFIDEDKERARQETIEGGEPRSRLVELYLENGFPNTAENIKDHIKNWSPEQLQGAIDVQVATREYMNEMSKFNGREMSGNAKVDVLRKFQGMSAEDVRQETTQLIQGAERAAEQGKKKNELIDQMIDIQRRKGKSMSEEQAAGYKERLKNVDIKKLHKFVEFNS